MGLNSCSKSCLLSNISLRSFAHVIIILCSLQNVRSMGDDAFASCDRFLGAREARLLDALPCDMTDVSFCAHKGDLYPEKAMWHFKEENRALMRRLYGDLESNSVFREMRGLINPNKDDNEENDSKKEDKNEEKEDENASSLQYKIRVGSGFFQAREGSEVVNRRKVVRLRRKSTKAPLFVRGEEELRLNHKDSNDNKDKNDNEDESKDDYENSGSRDKDRSKDSTLKKEGNDALKTKKNDNKTKDDDNKSVRVKSDTNINTNNNASETKETSKVDENSTKESVELVPDVSAHALESATSTTATTSTTMTTTRTTTTTTTTATTTTTMSSTTTTTTSSSTTKSSLGLASLPAFPTAEKVDIEEALQRILSEVNLHNLEKMVSDLIPMDNDEDDSQNLAKTNVDKEKVLKEEKEEAKQEDFDFTGPSVSACPVTTEVVAPYWANNTRNQVLALLNIYPFEQYIHMERCEQEHKQMQCQRGCRCEQQYRLHRLLAFDPNNECRGIFSDWFKFPSFCICKCYGLKEELVGVKRRKPRAKLDVSSNLISDDEIGADDNEYDVDKESDAHFLYRPNQRATSHNNNS